MGGSTGDGVSPKASPKLGTPRCAGLGRIDDGIVAGKRGVEVAERVARMLAFFPRDTPPVLLLSAGEGLFRAGRLVELDSSPLEFVLGRFVDVEPRKRLAG